MRDEEPMDLRALRATGESKRRVVAGAMERIRALEERGGMGLLVEAVAWPARLVPLILPAAAALWIVLLLGNHEPRPEPSVAGATPESSVPMRPASIDADRVDPAVLTSAWGIEGSGGYLATTSPDQLLVTLAETAP